MQDNAIISLRSTIIITYYPIVWIKSWRSRLCQVKYGQISIIFNPSYVFCLGPLAMLMSRFIFLTLPQAFEEDQAQSLVLLTSFVWIISYSGLPRILIVRYLLVRVSGIEKDTTIILLFRGIKWQERTGEPNVSGSERMSCPETGSHTLAVPSCEADTMKSFERDHAKSENENVERQLFHYVVRINYVMRYCFVTRICI